MRNGQTCEETLSTLESPYVKFGFEGQTGVPKLMRCTLGFKVSTDSSYPTVFAAGHIGLIHAVVVVWPQRPLRNVFCLGKQALMFPVETQLGIIR